MKECGDAAETLERMAVPMGPQAVVGCTLPEAAAEPSAVVRAPVRGVLRKQLPAGLMNVPAVALTQPPPVV